MEAIIELLFVKLLRSLGGFVRFLFGTFIRKIGIGKERPYKLSEYINGIEKPTDKFWETGISHQFVNIIIGIICILLIIYIINTLS